MIGWAWGAYIRSLGRPHWTRQEPCSSPSVSSVFTGSSGVCFRASGNSTRIASCAGLGVGGQFAIGVTLVAETPRAPRGPTRLGWCRPAPPSANWMAAGGAILLGRMETGGPDRRRVALHVPGGRAAGRRWRSSFFASSKEPEQWLQGARRKRRWVIPELLLGIALARRMPSPHVSGARRVVGLWESASSVMTWSGARRSRVPRRGYAGAALAGQITRDRHHVPLRISGGSSASRLIRGLPSMSAARRPSPSASSRPWA